MTPAECRSKFEQLPQLVYLCCYRGGDPAYVHALTGQVYRLKTAKERTGLLSSEAVAAIAMYVAMEHPVSADPTPAMEAVFTGKGAEKILEALQAEARGWGR